MRQTDTGGTESQVSVVLGGLGQGMGINVASVSSSAAWDWGGEEAKQQRPFGL